MPSETVPSLELMVRETGRNRLLDLDGRETRNTAYFGPDGHEARKAASGLLMGRGDANNRIGPFFILDGANIRGPHDQTDTSAVA